MPTKAPVHKAASAHAPVFNWTGFYVGVNAGGAWGHSDVDSNIFNDGPPPSNTPALIAQINSINDTTFKPNSGIFGVQAGYDIHSGNLLLGGVLDFNWMRLKASRDLTSTGTGVVTIHDEMETGWLFTARPRLGFITGRWLIYGTAGLAVTRLKYSHNHTSVTGSISTAPASVSDTLLGWTAGAGLEAMLGRNWTVFAEYLYADFGDVDTPRVRVQNTLAGTLNTVYDHNINLTANIFRVGLNYKLK